MKLIRQEHGDYFSICVAGITLYLGLKYLNLLRYFQVVYCRHTWTNLLVIFLPRDLFMPNFNPKRSFFNFVLVKVYGVERHFQQYFSYIAVVSFIGGGYQR